MHRRWGYCDLKCDTPYQSGCPLAADFEQRHRLYGGSEDQPWHGRVRLRGLHDRRAATCRDHTNHSNLFCQCSGELRSACVRFRCRKRSLKPSGANVGVSSRNSTSPGIASIATFETTIRSDGAIWDTINFSAEAWSKNFTPIGNDNLLNPFVYRIGASYGHAFSEDLYTDLDLHFAKGRENATNLQTYRALVGWRPRQDLSITAEAAYENTNPTGRSGITFRVQLTAQLDQTQSAIATYDSGQRSERLLYQRLSGEGDGALNITGALERSPGITGLNGSADLLTSAAELGIDQVSDFGNDQIPASSRAIARIGMSAAYADGSFSIGRPIYDSFAIVTRNRNLGDAEVILDATPEGQAASSTFLGTATEPDLNSYSERTIRADAPDAPPDVDLGKGAFRVFPPFHSGYRLEVGSDYAVTAFGKLVSSDGQPLGLVAGSATELQGAAGTVSLDLFTSRDGRFALSGLRPGRWRLTMQTDPPISYIIDIPEGGGHIVKLGDIEPSREEGK